jgi:hypothetical protein
VIQLWVAVLAALVTAVGWVINHRLTERREREAKQLEAALKYTERQLEELYGPLAFLLLESRRTFRDLLDSLGRNYVFTEGEDLPESELQTWLFWAENDAMPRNERIKQLLIQKTHLIEGEWFPDSYVDFLDHHNSWMINHLRWQRERVPYSFHSKINWPQQFAVEVLATFQAIKRRHAGYLRLQAKAAGLAVQSGPPSAKQPPWMDPARYGR